jgi:hypothetical protein
MVAIVCPAPVIFGAMVVEVDRMGDSFVMGAGALLVLWIPEDKYI